MLAGIIFYPIARTLYASFCEVDRRGNPVRFGTLENYSALFRDRIFTEAVVPHTLIWTAAVVGVTLVLSVILAVTLHEALPGRRFFRAVILLPWATSLVISAAVLKYILDPTRGPLNDLLGRLGLVTDNPAWLAHPETAFASVIAVGIWVSIPFTTVVILAGLQSIPGDIYEAATLDGAGGLQRFWRITLPLLRPVLTVAVVLNVIYVFNSFPIIWVLTEGGPANQTHIIVTYLYRRAIEQRFFGAGYAMAAITFAVLLLFSALYTRFALRRGEADL